MNEISTKVKEELLKSCPFCGGKATVESVEGAGISDGTWSVGCDDNGGEGECLGYQSMTTFARRSEAVAAWNRRSNECTCVNATLVKPAEAA